MAPTILKPKVCAGEKPVPSGKIQKRRASAPPPTVKLPPAVVEQKSFLHSILTHAPAMQNITSRLNYRDMKNLSATSNDWWLATSDEIANNSVFLLGPDRDSTRPYKTGIACCTTKALQASSLPQNLPLERLSWTYGLVKPEFINLYPTLKHLHVNNCFFRSGAYDGVTHLSVHLDEYRFAATFSNIGNAVFKDLVSFTYTENHPSFTPSVFTSLCTFLEKHPGLRSVELNVSSEDVYSTMANYNLNLERLVLKRCCLSLQSIKSINSIASLNSLILHNCICKDIFEIDLKKLNVFETNEEVKLTDESLARWIPSSSNMWSFTLTNVEQFSDSPFAFLARNFPNLEELSLCASSYPIHWDRCEPVTFPKLKVLKLSRISGHCNLNTPQLTVVEPESV